MSAPVEAQSLSSLTYLLANPPQYPRNPTHEIHQSLTLYIVRVPGSEDVFLTPIKPPTKTSVSLDAINSSLYYFHVETPEEIAAKRSVEASRRTSEESQRSVQSIARKPLPASARPPSPPPHVHLPQSRAGSIRDSLVDSTTRLRLDTTHHVSAFTSTHGAATIPAVHSGTTPYRSPYTQDAPSLRSLKIQPLARLRTAPKITIIRRDPSSGVQWNIGTIAQLQPTFSGSTVKPLEIQLVTAGYCRFNRYPETPRPNSAGSDATSVRRAMIDALSQSQTAADDGDDGDDEPPRPFFSRIVDFRNMTAVDVDRHVYQRTNSVGSSTNTDAAKMLSQKHVLQFMSPWNGTCSFINAIDGRTLRLQHTVHSTTSTAESATNKIAELRFNLFSNVFTNRSYRGGTEREEEYLPVSELIRTKKQKFRRSLHELRHHSWESRRSKHESSLPPAHDPLRNLTNITTPTTNNLYTHETVNSLSLLHENQTADHIAEGRISLKLGRERAGGGFRGQSAKLGKLIIEDEGLKMCDLVVAACMGVWWQHYDKSENRTT